MRKITLNNWVQILFSLSIFILLIYILFFTSNRLVYDEVNFYPNINLFKKLGFSHNFLILIDNQSPGPLFQIFHSYLESFTNLNLVKMRFVNLILLIFIFIILRGVLKMLNLTLTPAYYIIAIPMTWVIAGIALTELPAMFFCTSSIYFLIKSINFSKCLFKIRLFYSLLSGFLLGLSIIGRAPYLVILISTLVFFFKSTREIKLLLITFIISSSIFPFYIFYEWHGIVPPKSQTIQTGFDIIFGLLAFAYGGLIILLISPNWYIVNKKIIFILFILFILSFIINYSFLNYQFLPLKAFFVNNFSNIFINFISILLPSFLFTISVYFLFSSFVQVLINFNDVIFVFFTISFILILATCFKSSAQFSSRYVSQGTPFLILMIAKNDKLNLFKIFILIIGVLIGYYSLNSYYH